MSAHHHHHLTEELEALTKALSGCGGLGVDEKSLISAFGDHPPEKRSLFRKACPTFFKPGASLELWDDDQIRRLKFEFARFKDVAVLWTMHPWERDARWAHHVLHKAFPFNILVELACTRSSEELLGARRAYHALYHHSLEEDVAYHVKENHSNLLVGLVSAYRYEGPRVNEDIAKSEAKALGDAVLKDGGEKKAVENGEVIRILTTRSKLHLRVVFQHYKDKYGKSIVEDLGGEPCLQETVQCLNSPATYFSQVIDKALKGEDKRTKEALTRVIVSRADVDMKEIKEEYHNLYGAQLEDDIAKNTHGNYKDALLSLVGRKA